MTATKKLATINPDRIFSKPLRHRTSISALFFQTVMAPGSEAHAQRCSSQPVLPCNSHCMD